MADLADYANPLNTNNDVQIAAAIAQAAQDGVLRVPPNALYRHANKLTLPGHIRLLGDTGRTLSAGAPENGGTGGFWGGFIITDPLQPSMRIGDGNVNEDGAMRNVIFGRPDAPVPTSAAGAVPMLEGFGVVARYRMENVQIKAAGRCLALMPDPAGGCPFDWRMRTLYLNSVQSAITVAKGYGHKLMDTIHNGMDGLGRGYLDQSALVDITGEVDGFEILDRCVANQNGRGLLYAHGNKPVTGIVIDNSWYDKVGTAGVSIAPLAGGSFYKFRINMLAWGGGAGVPGAAPALMLETKAADDIRRGLVSIDGVNVRGPLVFTADRSASGTAGRINAVRFVDCFSEDGSFASPGSYPMFEFAGCTGRNNSLRGCEGNANNPSLYNSGHSALMANFSQMQGGSWYQGPECRLY